MCNSSPANYCATVAPSSARCSAPVGACAPVAPSARGRRGVEHPLLASSSLGRKVANHECFVSAWCS
eukprot:13738214-Heterocapsa_arctica.AAC.1